MVSMQDWSRLWSCCCEQNPWSANTEIAIRCVSACSKRTPQPSPNPWSAQATRVQANPGAERLQDGGATKQGCQGQLLRHLRLRARKNLEQHRVFLFLFLCGLQVLKYNVAKDLLQSGLLTRLCKKPGKRTWLHLDGNTAWDRATKDLRLGHIKCDHVCHSKKEYHRKHARRADGGTQCMDAKWQSPAKQGGKPNSWLDVLTFSWSLRHNMKQRTSEELLKVPELGLQMYRKKYLQ